jgi:hypothetical protein
MLSWGVLAYFWSLINDNPVNADGLLGRQGYYLMEVILNLLSFLCFCLAAREAIKGRAIPGTTLKVALWTVLAFLWSSADDIPFLADRLGVSKTESWYSFDIAIHAASLVFFYLAVRGSSSPGKTIGPKAGNRHSFAIFCESRLLKETRCATPRHTFPLRPPERCR